MRRVPFQLPGLLKALKTGETIFIVEGPRKCEPLHEWGLCATCNISRPPRRLGLARARERDFPSDSWYHRLSSYCRTMTLPAPECGDHADALASVGVADQILDLPGLPVKGDLINWIDGGGTVSVV